MKAPLQKVADSTLNRHFLQLAVTRALFADEHSTLCQLQDMGLSTHISGILLYIDDHGSTIYHLPKWWISRGKGLVRALAS
jgi:hypothetical protein